MSLGLEPDLEAIEDVGSKCRRRAYFGVLNSAPQRLANPERGIDRVQPTSKDKNMKKSLVLIGINLVLVTGLFAQTTGFTYQGSLQSGGNPANGNFDFEFVLFDALVGGAQIGSVLSLDGVAVTDSRFAVSLDFGNQFPGSDRFLEIRVRPAGQPGVTVLSPRQLVNSSPYSLKSLVADDAANAANALRLGGIAASQYVVTTDPRMSDARTPTAGSDNYLQNTNVPQLATNFSISGNGSVGGILSGNIVNAETQVSIGGSRVLSMPGVANIFAGVNAGGGNTTGTDNSFFGWNSGQVNTTGNRNSFFGSNAGRSNTTGGGNSFFGDIAGQSNTTGNSNSFFGRGAGESNTSGMQNSFFGILAGQVNTTGIQNSFFGNIAGQSNTTGSNNSFYGSRAGFANTTGIQNSFFGDAAGLLNTTGSSNSFFGRTAGVANTTASENSFFGHAAGSSNTTGSNNSFFGKSAGESNTTGNGNSFFGWNAGQQSLTGNGNAFFGNGAGRANTTGGFNSFVGSLAGESNTIGLSNSFFGREAGRLNTSGNGNSFFGREAGRSNTEGSQNSFFGQLAGRSNTTGNSNSFFGIYAGRFNSTGDSNSFFGFEAGVATTTGFFNSFFGVEAGHSNTTGLGNSFFGFEAGISNTTGQGNAFFGRWAGNANTTGDFNSALGTGATVATGNLNNATAIGAGAVVTSSDTVVLGRAADDVEIPGRLVLSGLGVVNNFTVTGSLSVSGITSVLNLGPGGAVTLCRNTFLQIASCSSSIRYKSDIHPFRPGINLITRLRPVSFNWSEGGMSDMGLIAEEVANIEPLLVTYNDKGEVEGVKYDRIGVVLINAVREQQEQIEEQRRVIDGLTRSAKEHAALINAQKAQLDALTEYLCRNDKPLPICAVQENKDER